MWESRRDSQENWEGWKAGLWLSMLSNSRHFHRAALTLQGRFGLEGMTTSAFVVLMSEFTNAL